MPSDQFYVPANIQAPPHDGSHVPANTVDLVTLGTNQHSEAYTTGDLRRSNSLFVEFLIPPTDEVAAVAYIYESVQLSSRDAAAQTYIFENVTEGIPHPHIWYVYPDEGVRGQVIVVVGHGFGATQELYNGKVVFGPTTPDVLTWVQSPASMSNPLPGEIDAENDQADPEHQRVTFAIPNNAVSADVRIITDTDEVVQPPPPPPVAKFDADTGAGVDAHSITSAISSSDVAAASETELLAPADKFDSDTGAGIEGEAVSASLTDGEVAAGAEGDLVEVPPPAIDTFDYTGSMQSVVVPDGATTATIELSGAQGGTGGGWVHAGNVGGNGNKLTCVLPVTPGETLYIFVGGQNGYNGGGGASGALYTNGGVGGGATDIRRGGTALANRILISGGGGGGGAGGGQAWIHGGAGGSGGELGVAGNNAYSGSTGGGGGTASAGGAGGGGNRGGDAGTLGAGGSSATNTPYAGGGGGGGGYYGGGGGGAQAGGQDSGSGGGGGSSYADASATSVVFTAGDRAGHGVVTVAWS